jgi:uncharacterized UBP type Zn finger protein
VAASRSAKKIKTSPAALPKQVAKLGRKKDEKDGSNRNLDPQTTIQGNKHMRNTCYITSLLAALFAVICFAREAKIELPFGEESQNAKKFLLIEIWEHLLTRYPSLI